MRAVPRLRASRAVELRQLAERSRHVVVLAAVTGALTGLVVAGFEHVVVLLRDAVVDLPTWAIAVVPTVGLALAAVALAVARTGAGTSDEYIRTFHDREELRPRDAVARLVAAVATLGSGAPMGLEGPSLYFGASIGSAVRRATRRLTSGADDRLLLVAGAAAGVAAIFKAPATGAIFALEVPYHGHLFDLIVLDLDEERAVRGLQRQPEARAARGVVDHVIGRADPHRHAAAGEQIEPGRAEREAVEAFRGQGIKAARTAAPVDLPHGHLGHKPPIQLHHHQPIPRDAKGNKHRTNQRLKSIKFGGRR